MEWNEAELDLLEVHEHAVCFRESCFPADVRLALVGPLIALHETKNWTRRGFAVATAPRYKNDR